MKAIAGLAVALVLMVLASLSLLGWKVDAGVYAPYNTPTSSSIRSIGGLRLFLTLSTSSVAQGQGVEVTVWIFNPHTGEVHVSAATGWMREDFGTGPCGAQNFPMGILMFKGNLSLEEIEFAQPLQLYEGLPEAYHCPVKYAFSAYHFRSLSVNATFELFCGSTSACEGPTVAMNVSMAFGGYYSQAGFKTFDPGIYTIVAGDEWGAITALHFEVTPTHTP